MLTGPGVVWRLSLNGQVCTVGALVVSFSCDFSNMGQPLVLFPQTRLCSSQWHPHLDHIEEDQAVISCSCLTF